MTAFRYLIAGLIIAFACMPNSAFAISADDGFNPNANGTIWTSAVQSDGKILIGGYFTTIGGTPRNYIARLNADGSLDAAFNPDASSYVNSITVQEDGKILIGGAFTSIGGTTRNKIARLNADGSLDAAFDPDANSSVHSIAVQEDGKILIGGWFTRVGGIRRYNIARLSAGGSLDTAFDPNFDPDEEDGDIPGGDVYSIVVQSDGKILIGGYFTDIGFTARNAIARLNSDGTLDTFNPGATGVDPIVYSIAMQSDGKILVGGDFTGLGGGARNRIARLNADGSLVAAFDPNANGDVRSIAEQADGKIIVGGFFTTVGGTARNYIARLNADGSLESSFDPNASYFVYSIAAQEDGKILIGGSFTSIGGTTRNYIARLNPDGSLETSFDPNANNSVYSAVAQGDEKILIGGAFTDIGGTIRNRIARFKYGYLETSFDPNAGSTVYAIAVQTDGKILISGGFTTIGGIGRNRIARLNADGSLDDTFNPNAAGTVYSIVEQEDGKILVGGTFLSIAGGTRNRIARLNADGSLDDTFDPNAGSTVTSLSVQADGKIIVGGLFLTMGGTTRNRIARLNADGSLDDTFNPNAGNAVYSTAVQADGKIIIGGTFTTIGVTTRNKIARLNADGSLDDTFNPNAGSTVYSIALQTDGKILIGGSFATIGGVVRNRVARLNADGSLDDTFDPNAGSTVNSLSVQADGKVLIGGAFTTIAGVTRNRIARVTNTDAALQTLTSSTDGSSLTWMRSGTTPEVWRVTFEQSADGTSWTPLGNGTRISGGWELTELGLPFNQNFYIRASGYASGGYFNGSTSLIESVNMLYTYNADVNAPTGTININSDAAYTASASVTLSLSCSDVGTGCAKMKFSNDNVAWSNSENYSATRAWTVTSGDGTKTVYVKFRDTSGNWSEVYSDTIVLDMNAPSTTALPAGGTYDCSTQNVTLTCNDEAGSGCATTYYCTGAECAPATVYSGAIAISASTTLRFYSEDNANNSESVKTEVYTINKPAPSAGFSGSPTSGDAPLTVNFTNSSTGLCGPLTNEWDFDNNGSVESTLLNPSYEYTSAGTYSIKLTVTDSVGGTNSLTRLNYITVTASCLSPVKVISSGFYYTDIQTAYDEAGVSDSILIQEGTFTENILIDLSKTVTLTGGYDCDFSAVTGQTIISGNMTLSDGAVTMENIKIQ